MKQERRNRLAKEASSKSKEQSQFGVIGRVVEYYPPTLTSRPEIEHTADVRVMMGAKSQVLKRVPCFVYGSSAFDYGLYKNDRVFINFMDGDLQHPVITGYYREPKLGQRFFNTIQYGVSKVLEDIL